MSSFPKHFPPAAFSAYCGIPWRQEKGWPHFPIFFFFLEGKTNLDKISHTTLKETQNPNSQRLSTYSRRSSARPHPTPSQGGKESIKPALDTWIGKTFIPLLEGKAEAGSIWEGREGEGPWRACEQSCSSQGPGPCHWFSSRKKSL